METLRNVKTWIKANFPGSVELLYSKPRRAIERAYSATLLSPARVFSNIYVNNTWRGTESVSGPGSDLKTTAIIREELPIVLGELGVRSLLDAPCGDFNWMKDVNLNLDRYIGVDIVPDLIQHNQRYADETRVFMLRDITRDELPRVDLILCRDCLVHLPTRLVWACLKNFKRSGSRYLITTTFPGPSLTVPTRNGRYVSKNRDIVMGGWRPIDFELPPFNFPRPLKLIYERRPYVPSTKSLGVWNLRELKI